MGGEGPTVPPMAPLDFSRNMKANDEQDTSWVPFKCKYLTIGSFHTITPADIIDYNSNPFLKSRPKSFTLNNKSDKQALVNSNKTTIVKSNSLNRNGRIHHLSSNNLNDIQLSNCSLKNEQEENNILKDIPKPFQIIDENKTVLLNGDVKRRLSDDIESCSSYSGNSTNSTPNVDSDYGSDATPDSAQLKHVQTLTRSRNGSIKSTKSKISKKSRQPMKNLCCCWSVPSNQLSDSGGPAEGQRVPDPNNVVISNESFSRSTSSRGSLRKVLPSVPDMDQQLSMSAKMIDRRTSTPKGNHSYGPYFLEYTLLAEYNLLQTQRVNGLYVVPSANSSLIWFGVIFVRQGPYREGVFRFNLHIPDNFPDGDVPSVIFESKVFHPLIHPDTGELDVKRGFANKWKRNVNHIWHILSYLRKSLYKIDTTDPSNPEAAALYTNDNEMFNSRVKECVSKSKESVYDPPNTTDPHAIIFSPYQPAVHDVVREELKKERNPDDMSDENSNQGLSWVKPGTLQIFSKTAS